MSIKDWNIDERPREKLIKHGPQVLSAAELLAILIGSGTKEKSALELAKELLKTAGDDIAYLGRLSVDEIRNIKGIGVARAVVISAALELGRRRSLSDNEPVKIRSSKDAAGIFMPLLSDLTHEEFWVLYLSTANTVMYVERVSRGSDVASVIDVKEIVRNAIFKKARNIIVAHNHPSGCVNPGGSDIALTEKLAGALMYFDIKLLDHIIIGNNKFYSFADEGKL
jgi:DNA repair protein RadC